MGRLRTVVAVLLWRVLNAALVQTAAAPDEYWQALEPAHRWVFGYGHLTWEWHRHIRGYAFPAVYAAAYAAVRAAGLEHTDWIVWPCALSATRA